ncbi:MAG TPA: ABC transporter permease [Pyrinomonadaceae bacterium]|jgi:predicted permease|nr:ABC transporter permease [Pyrinomonadaceae bacterium]
MPEWKTEIAKHLARLGLTPTREAEIVEELSQHLDDRYEELLSAGATAERAYRAALDELTESELLTKELRHVERRADAGRVVLGEGGRGNVIADLWQDLRYGFRMLRNQPGFAAVALLTLALGVGANTAIFRLIDAVRLRALPVAHPEQLAEVRIADMTGARGFFASWHPALTNPVWEQVRDRQQAFSGVFAWGAEDFNLGTGSEVHRARGLWVSGDFFDVLGVRPEVGRVFHAPDDRRGCAAAGAVLSHQFWQREFGGDPSVVGRTLSVDDHAVEIVGVTPAGFYGPEVGRSFDVAVPVCSAALLRDDGRLDSGTSWWLIVMGRLRPGWTAEQATAHLGSISQGVFETTLSPKYPAENVSNYLGFKLAAYPAASGISQVRETYESPLWMLLGVAGLVLLIACANLANLMLARASAREREIAVRLALGASRSRIVRQLLAESLLLSAAGSILGAILAGFLGEFLVSFLSTKEDQLFVDLSANWSVLGFTAGMAILTCVLFGLTPALRATRVAPGAAMKASGRGMTAGRERFSLRRALVVAQVALSLVLVVGALLFSRSLAKLLSADVGFRQEGILIAQIDSSRLNLPKENRLTFKRGLLERIRAIPGVASAASANIIPLSGNGWGNSVWMDGADAAGKKPMNFIRVSGDYFKTMGTPLVAGRDFEEHDAPSSPKVVVVNEEFARQMGGGANPVGKSLWVEQSISDPETRYEIVGLVRSTKYNTVREDFQPVVYFPLTQAPRLGQVDQVLVSSNAPLAELTAGVKRAVAEASPQSTTDFRVLREQIQNSLMSDRLMATLSGFFGLLALVLACVGLYGITSYGVAGRTNELGIRMALGAQPWDVRRMILRETFALVGVGVCIGLPAAFFATRLVSTLLFGLTPADPVSIGLAALMMLGVALVAGYVPARRASRVDPMVALRHE